jgi:hypothetical protein
MQAETINVRNRPNQWAGHVLARRLSENEKFVARSRKAKILTAGIH